MIKRVLVLLLLIIGVSHAEEKSGSLSDFSGGLNSNYSPITIADNEVQDSLNVWFDDDNAVDKRKGFSLYATTTPVSFTNGFAYTDASNNNWLITLSSDSIRASKGDGTFSVVIATVPTPTQSLVDAVPAFGNVYFVDNLQGVYFWNGTSTTYVSGSPRGSIITEYKGRLFVAGEAHPNQNYLTASGYLNGSNWTTGSLDTDPIVFIVGLNDKADGITGLLSGYNDAIYIFKRNSINALYGFDQSDFQVRILTNETGSIDGGTIKSYKNGIVFLSKRGFEMFDGVNSTVISKKVNNRLAAALLTSFNQKSWIQTSASDWSAGTPTAVSTSAVLGDVTSLTTSYAIAASTDFAPGTAGGNTVFYDTSTVPGKIQTTWPDLFDAYRDGNSSTKQVWRTWATAPSISGGYFQNGRIENVNQNTASAGGTTFYFRLETPSNKSAGWTITVSTDYPSVTPISSGSSFVWLSNSGATRTGSSTHFLARDKNHTAGVTPPLDNPAVADETLTAYSYPIDLTIWVSTYGYVVTANNTAIFRASIADASFGSGYRVSIDGGYGGGGDAAPYYVNFASMGVAPQTFTWTSPVYDTGITSPIWETFSTVQTGTGTISYTTRVGTSSVLLDTAVAVATGTLITSASKRYIQLQASFDGSISSGVVTALDQANIVAGSTGTFVSQAFNIGTGISAFGTFDAVYSVGGGTLDFAICTANNSAMTSQVCVSQTPNAQITVATNTYVQVRSTFSVTSSVTPASLQSFTVKWNEGTRRPRMTSAIYKDRYWVSLATNSLSAANDSTWVLSQNPKTGQLIWTVFDITAGAFITYRDLLYHADANATGKVYVDDLGTNDNGTLITAYIKTKAYLFDGIIAEKVYRKLWLFADSLSGYTITTSYFLDRSPTEYSLGTIDTSQFNTLTNAKLPFPLSTANQVFGKTIALKFLNSQDRDMKLYGAEVYYDLRKVE